MAAQRHLRISPDEYLAQERSATRKSEFVAGTILGMAGGSPRHNQIAGNAFSALDQALADDNPCIPFNSDQRVRIGELGPYFYPDTIHTEQPLVEHYSRIEGDIWRVSSLEGLESVLYLPVLELAVPLTQLYRRIAFPPPGGAAGRES